MPMSLQGILQRDALPFVALIELSAGHSSMLMSAPTDFEWHEPKATSNYIDHGIPFEAAARVFFDGDRLDVVDDCRNYGEERRIAIGTVDGVCMSVVYTLRNGVVRIISARRASRKERRS